MFKELEGYVVYYKDSKKNIPFGVVSEYYECNAITNFIPAKLKDYLVEIEDKRFFEHKGFDLKGITRALFENIKAGKIVQGGSTITQQLARNILRDNRKLVIRKIRETIKALEIENKHTKDEILNLYFNNVYFGKNLRGIRTAGLYYFGKEVEKLNQSELLFLLTILRGPNFYSKMPELATNRLRFISNSLHEKKMISTNRNQKNLKTKLKINSNLLLNIKNVTVPFITDKANIDKRKIISTIDISIQNLAHQFVSDSKYPVSIIAIKSNKVVAFASSYGTDYPFIYKSNVGSTLKPFLYCHLRDCGVSQFEKFNSYKNNLNWKVREVGRYNSQLNLNEALYHSNNNAFLNAAKNTDIGNSLSFLANIFNRDKEEFYPSSILGATKKGITLFELASAYSSFFSPKSLTPHKKECLKILNKVFIDKLEVQIENAFLKTGTTNDNKDRFAVLGNHELTFAILRNENELNDLSKEGGFMSQIRKSFSSLFKTNNNYKWI